MATSSQIRLAEFRFYEALNEFLAPAFPPAIILNHVSGPQ